MKHPYKLLLFTLVISSCSNVSNKVVTLSSFQIDDSTSSIVNNESLISTESSSSSFSSSEEIKDLDIIEYKGDLESAYVKWKDNTTFTSYKVSFKEKNETIFKEVDDMLIRYYPEYVRVDIPGLKEGTYDIKIEGINGNSVLKEKTLQVEVLKHIREGFAFKDGSSSGAYNDDGTLKANAKVIYITKNNAKTVSVQLGKKSYTGFQKIIKAKETSDTQIQDIPLCFRIIGNIHIDDLDCYLSQDEGLAIKGKSGFNNMNITLEGIGDDAYFNYFGLLIRNCNNVEVRNLGFMNAIDDSISIDTKNSHIWVHNCDLFYGQEGNEADKVKGDGAIDTKGSTLITHSFNHFWDAGKCNLQGMKSELPTNSITYHHNYYDHSDSRHPRVRTGTIHVYNNYYSGNAKYGVGATMGASVFVENNYFRNCKYPILSSMQGSDTKGNSKGTFSSEDGGLVKSFNNYMVGQSSYIPYSKDHVEFDAYEVKSKEEVVPDNVLTKKGANAYNNFDTKEDMYKYTVQTPLEAKATVEEYAGRVNGGDLKYVFTSKDDSDYALNNELKAMIINYTSKLIKVKGESK